eukprot:6527933-Pyramimonas_sp.AAC.1
MGDAALEQFCILAKSAKGRAAVQIIAEATSASNLFAFGELLDQPNLKELKGTEYAASYELLRMFAHGTWSDYKGEANRPVRRWDASRAQRRATAETKATDGSFACGEREGAPQLPSWTPPQASPSV